MGIIGVLGAMIFFTIAQATELQYQPDIELYNLNAGRYIHAPIVWQCTTSSEDVGIGMFDHSGNYNHPNLGSDWKDAKSSFRTTIFYRGGVITTYYNSEGWSPVLSMGIEIYHRFKSYPTLGIRGEVSWAYHDFLGEYAAPEITEAYENLWDFILSFVLKKNIKYCDLGINIGYHCCLDKSTVTYTPEPSGGSLRQTNFWGEPLASVTVGIKEKKFLSLPFLSLVIEWRCTFYFDRRFYQHTVFQEARRPSRMLSLYSMVEFTL